MYLGISYAAALVFTSPTNFISINKPENVQFEEVSFETSDSVTIRGWYFAKENFNKCIILLHGFKANKMEPLPRVQMFLENGFNVLIYDARGHGESEAALNSIGFYEQEDLTAAVNFINDKNINNIYCDGISQGGATIVYALANGKLKNVKAVILESVYDDLHKAIDNRFKKYTLLPADVAGYFMVKFAEDRLDISVSQMKPYESIKKINIPVLIISGTDDSNTKVEDTDHLFENANSPKELVMFEGAGHEDLYKFNQELYKKSLISFLNNY
ncbi:MAG TPA: alpha/beta fold hydrolase [Ignavibacteria bacterium]|nr:alpha/beta fold hydrolase [Ignavibacteria bacterium]